MPAPNDKQPRTVQSGPQVKRPQNPYQPSSKSANRASTDTFDEEIVRTSPMSLRTIEQFCYRMGVGIRAGVDLLKLFDVEKKQGSAHHQQMTTLVAERIRAGSTMAQAMKQAGGYYPHMLVQMVAAGESGGGLEKSFTYMSDYYRDLRKARNDFLQQIAWPVIQLTLALLIISTVIVLRGVLSPPSNNPNDLQFDSTGIGLSGLSGLAFFWLVILGIAAPIVLIGYGIRQNWFHAHQRLLPIARNIPIIGTVLTTSALSRLSITLSMLLNAGVDARRCLREAFRATGNHYYIAGLPAAESVLGKGHSFADALEASRVFPNDFVRAIEVGELSGTETDSLDRLAIDYNRRASSAMTQLAVSCSVGVWLMVSIFIIFIIIRMFMNYVDLLNNAGKM